MRTGDSATPSRSDRGFTLIETIVAIGILALVTVGVAAIFQTVGDTVSAGKRLSSLNRRAAQIERIIRRDFEQMVLDDGFLVIRNEVAQTQWDNMIVPLPGPTSDRVPLFEGQPEGERRLRRIDELMFFARGDFTSGRSPLHPAVVARSQTARVYYGHGQKFPDDTSDRSIRPTLDEPNNVVGARLGELSAGLAVNPNEFAADWSLLRQTTLLVPRDEVFRELPRQVAHFNRINLSTQGRNGGDQPVLAQVNRVRNHSRQIALQPAAQSIFRSVAALTPDLPSETMGPNTPWGLRPAQGIMSGRNGAERFSDQFMWMDERLAAPQFTSGLVDIATMTLTDMKAFITSPKLGFVGGMPRLVGARYEPDLLLPDDVTLPNFTYPSVAGLQAFETGLETSLPFDRNNPLQNAITFDRSNTPEITTTRLDHQVQQLWMLDALPSVPWRQDFPNLSGFRVRYADDPPALLPDEPLLSQGENPEDRLLDAIEQADQEMLRSSVFLQGCSEFIVEWTYGVIDLLPTSPTLGQPVWFGLQRFADLNADGQYQQGNEFLVAEQWNNLNQYDGREIRRMQDEFDIPLNLLEGAALSPLDPAVQASTVVRENGANLNPPIGPSTSYVFGYYRAGIDGQSRPETGPWPWPSLIRITIRLVDPEDRQVETTYQATFRVPDRSSF